MSETNLSVFRRSLLASGLLRPDQLAQAERDAGSAAAAGSVSPATVTAQIRSAEQGLPSADQLASYLVATGLLNAWQVEQLRHGRSKFNLGPYQMLDSLGQGGMGQVFKAEHTIMGRIVAVKVLPRHRSSPEAIASFHREIRAQAQLDHHNLVRALDAGRDGNVHFLVTEYVPGADLRKLVRQRGRLSMQAAASIISQAAQGLAHAHARGMIHRDIKPGNLLVTPEGLVKISDLGLVGYFGETAADDPHPGKIVGTADYLSPEQIAAPSQIGPGSDVYGLGCTLYYAVTGKVPFPGGTTRDKAHAHCHLQPLDPRRLNPELSDEFVDVLADMMAKDLARRIGHGEQVIEGLAPWARLDAARAAAGGVAQGDTSTAMASNVGWPGAHEPESDTQPSFVIREVLPEASPGQASQSTSPVAQDREETIRLVLDAPGVPRARHPASSGWLRWTLLAGLGLALAGFGALVAEMFRRWN